MFAFYTTAGPCWLTLSLPSTAVISSTPHNYCPENGHSSSLFFLPGCKILHLPLLAIFLFYFLFWFLQSAKDHFEIWFCTNCGLSHAVKIRSDSFWAVFSSLCIKTFPWPCAIGSCSPFPKGLWVPPKLHWFFWWLQLLLTKSLLHRISSLSDPTTTALTFSSPSLWSLTVLLQGVPLLDLSVFSMATHHWYKKHHSLLAVPKQAVYFHVNIPAGVTSLLGWSDHNFAFIPTLTAAPLVPCGRNKPNHCQISGNWLSGSTY